MLHLLKTVPNNVTSAGNHYSYVQDVSLVDTILNKTVINIIEHKSITIYKGMNIISMVQQLYNK